MCMETFYEVKARKLAEMNTNLDVAAQESTVAEYTAMVDAKNQELARVQSEYDFLKAELEANTPQPVQEPVEETPAEEPQTEEVEG